MNRTFLLLLVLNIAALAGDQTRLARAYIQKMRETTDAAYLGRAQKLLDQVLATRPSDFEALSLQNELDLFAHQFDAVIERARALVQRQPGDAASWAMLGDAYMETGRYREAESAYQKLLDLDAGLMSLNRAAWFRFVTGDLEGAIGLMLRAVRSGRPGHEHTAWCAVELGNLYQKAGRLEDAEAAYRFALSTFAGSHAAWRGLGQVAMDRRHFEEAAGHFRKAQSMAPLVEYTGLLAAAYRELGKSGDVRRQLELLDVTARMEAASGRKGNRQLALYWADHGYRLQDALDVAAADLAVRKDVYTWDAYAWALFKNGRIEEAARAIQHALREGTPEPLFQHHADAIRAAMPPHPPASLSTPGSQ